MTDSPNTRRTRGWSWRLHPSGSLSRNFPPTLRIPFSVASFIMANNQSGSATSSSSKLAIHSPRASSSLDVAHGLARFGLEELTQWDFGFWLEVLDHLGRAVG